MKIHVLPNPSKIVDGLDSIDPFNIAAWKYIKHLGYKYEMILYGLSGSNANCETVSIDATGNISKFNDIASTEIKKRKSAGDIIVCFYGCDNQAATLAHSDCKIVEPSVGYRASAVFSKYRAFVSYAQMHMFYGERGMLMSPSWADAVIPNSFTVEDFAFNDTKEDYFLYFGRVIEEKGIDICIELTQKLEKKLVIAGPRYDDVPRYKSFPSHVEYIGVCDQKQRNEVMSKAQCLVGPTLYVEPFGNMVIEANLCGTPVLTSDWGGFTETVIQGKTGFRCRDLGSFLAAANKIHQIDPVECRNHGLTYSDENIHLMHDIYLQKVISCDSV